MLCCACGIGPGSQCAASQSSARDLQAKEMKLQAMARSVQGASTATMNRFAPKREPTPFETSVYEVPCLKWNLNCLVFISLCPRTADA